MPHQPRQCVRCLTLQLEFAAPHPTHHTTLTLFARLFCSAWISATCTPLPSTPSFPRSVLLVGTLGLAAAGLVLRQWALVLVQCRNGLTHDVRMGRDRCRISWSRRRCATSACTARWRWRQSASASVHSRVVPRTSFHPLDPFARLISSSPFVSSRPSLSRLTLSLD